MVAIPRAVAVSLVLATLALPACGNKGALVRPPPQAAAGNATAPPADELPPPTEPSEADTPAEIQPPAAADPPSDPATAPVPSDVDGDG